MALEGNTICFWGGSSEAIAGHRYFARFPPNSPIGIGVEIVIQVRDVEDLYEECRSWANIVDPLKARPWGLVDFRVADPYGYYLRITEIHDVRDSRFAIP